MARMEIVSGGIAGRAASDRLGEDAERALMAAADVLTAALKNSAPVGETGQLRDSIKPTKVKRTDNEMYVDVYPQGTRKKERGRKNAVRNAEVAFVLEHGTSKVQATHWMSNTIDDTADEVINILEGGVLPAMEDALLGALNNIGG